jgi:general secretion pathway protein I
VNRSRARGFTLVEVLVALMIVAMGLSALLVAVTGTARTSGYLRDKTLAQWIALNRLTEVRLGANKPGQTPQSTQSSSTDTAEIKFANRTWHYDTRYFDTNIPSMKRIVVRVYLGDAKTKGNPIVESTSFFGTALAAPGTSNSTDWTTGSTAATASPNGTTPGTRANTTQSTLGVTPTPTTAPTTPVAPTPQVAPQ